MKKVYLLLVLSLIITLSNYGQTNVSGNILTDTEWNFAGSPYNFVGDVNLASETVLTIEPGVIIYGNNYSFNIYGILNAIGDSTNRIMFSNTNIAPGNNQGSPYYQINIAFSDIFGGTLYEPNGNGIYGSINVSYSRLRNINDYMYLWYPKDSCIFEYNVFDNTGGISIGTDDDGMVLIKNNIFHNIRNGYLDGSIENWASLNSDSATIVMNNSFLDTTNLAVGLKYSSSHLKAVNNYWNTTSISVIESMIHDKNDDFSLNDTIPFHPYLQYHHPETPIIAIFNADKTIGLEKEDTIRFYNGSQGYNIENWEWDFGDDTTSNSENPVHVYSTPGIYSVQLKIKNYQYSDIIVKNEFIEIEPFNVNAGEDKVISCGGSVQFDEPVTNYSGSESLSYLWSPGIFLNDSTIAQPIVEVYQDTEFVVKVSTINGCVAYDTVNVVMTSLSRPEICMVGVTNSNSNIIIWEQPLEHPYDSVLIFKESFQAGTFDLIGVQSAKQTSVFIDVDSNPSIQSYRYKIAILDTCKFLSPLSNFHKTIHLTINSGIAGSWNLIWDEYLGFEYYYYNIFRGTDSENMQLLTTVPSNLFSYTDLTPPDTTVYYQIEVQNPNPCVVNDITKSDVVYGSTRSNIVNSSEANNINSFEINRIEISPNPTIDKLTIRASESKLMYGWEIQNLSGKTVAKSSDPSLSYLINIGYFPAGVYMVKVLTSDNVMTSKFIKK